jgi:HAD superfamily hydrolase (TIGR01509 family)
VILDFDGVIADSEPLHFDAFREVLAAEAVTLTEQEYYGRYLGYDDLGVFRAVGNDRALSWSREHIAALAVRKARQLEELERTRSIVFPGASDAIRRLAARWPLAIASGALRSEILRVLERAGLRDCFAAIVAAGDTPASKPAPDPYLLAVAELARASGQALTPADCVAVEDSHWGLESARAAGLRTVAVTHTYRASDLGMADLVVESLEALDPARLHELTRP